MPLMSAWVRWMLKVVVVVLGVSAAAVTSNAVVTTNAVVASNGWGSPGRQFAWISQAEAKELDEEEAKRAQDLARTLMSPFCPGRTLQACPSPYAAEWREDIRLWVSEGLSSQEIRERLEARMPDKDLTGAPSTMMDNVLPALVAVSALVLLVLLLRKLLRKGTTDVGQALEAEVERLKNSDGLDASLEARLEAELDEMDAGEPEREGPGRERTDGDPPTHAGREP